MDHTADPAASRPIEVEDFVLRSVRESWDTFKADPLLYIAASLLVALVSAISLGILAGPMIVGFIEIVRRRRRGQSARVGDLRTGLSLFASSFVALLVIVLASAIGFALLVIPGLIVMVATCFAFHEIAYRRAHAADALRASWQLARRNLLHVLLVLVGVTALNSLGGAIVLGMLLTGPYALVWMTVAYELLTGQTADRTAFDVATAPVT
jgi:hypothetical protein